MANEIFPGADQTLSHTQTESQLDYGKLINRIAQNQPNNEGEIMTVDIKSETIAPNGLGFGEGGIGVVDRLNDPNDLLDQPTIDQVEKDSLSPETTIRVSNDCDTCPDGRRSGCIRLQDELGEITEIPDETFMSKVFGGGNAMIVASDIALGRADPTLTNSFRSARNRAKERGLKTGAHSSSSHSNEISSDCGAIDKAPVIVSNVSKYKSEIRQTLEVLFHPEVVKSQEFKTLVEEAFNNYDNYSKSDEFRAENYSGAAVVNDIMRGGSPIKIVEDDHLEIRARINIDIVGYTSNQRVVRSNAPKQINGAEKDVAQIFAWDVPRNLEIAKKCYDTDRERKLALLGQVIYSLSTAATLTKGDLPVDRIYKDSPYIRFDFDD